jgi:hypothetical protein
MALSAMQTIANAFSKKAKTGRSRVEPR